ncbi:Non-specific ribonucleoside hydrolase RihC [Microcoleus sp. IPMA8]|uniref:Non-specific ribonucleoside hydrolase RihC n=1 Tax=Microcoleus asticus IPMA8 TaxID=2563858 RepID=A0ABX2D476_9CYAN|nr:Non-specific ribonucleoside hydrolase RihC [Microcoleus asticus IPMA8]
MGGALNVIGNVSKDMEPGQDMLAEWNAYWNPIAIDRIWQTQIPVVMCPLDITNNVPLTAEFSNLLARQRKYLISDLAGQCYAIAISQDCYFWNILATAYLARPEFYQLREWETEIVTEGISQGRTKIKMKGEKFTQWIK